MSDVTATEREALQRRHELRLAEYDAAMKTIDNATDAIAATRLARRAQELLEEVRELERKIEELERDEVGEQIYQALLKLDYKAQRHLFFRLAPKYPLMALLIYGPEGFGQRWLVNRLLHNDAQVRRSRQFRFALSRLARSASVRDIWEELAVELGLRSSATSEQVAERLCDCWRTQPVLLFFDCELDQMAEQSFAAFVGEFWGPLLEVARRRQPPKHQLLVFFIDSSGCTRPQPLTFAETNDPALIPQNVVRLPLLSRFSAAELTGWANDDGIEHLPDLPDKLQVEALLAASDNGVPERVFRSICALYDYEWLSGKKAWLKIY